MTEPVEHPTNVCIVLLDSLNRHLLGSYGGTEFATPNLARFAAAQATRFTRHGTGALRRAIREYLGGQPLGMSAEDGEGPGGDGVTVAELE